MNVVLVGYGAMGERIVDRIGTTGGLSLVGVIDKMSNLGLNSFDELKIVPEVIIDFSHPANLKAMLDYAVDNKVGLVIATTGYTEDEETEIKAASKLIPIVKTSNTSLGIQVLLKAIRTITPALEEYDIEVIEKHHNQKLDSPSGTANLILDELQDSRKNSDLVYGRKGNQKRSQSEIGVHAVRGGTISGEHTVLFAGPDELIEIKHTALSKEVFVSGALKAAIYITDKNPGLYSMQDVLF